MQPRKIAFAVLRGTVFVRDLGQIGPTIDSRAPGQSNVSMSLADGFLTINTEYKTGGPCIILVPVTNVSHMVPATT